MSSSWRSIDAYFEQRALADDAKLRAEAQRAHRAHEPLLAALAEARIDPADVDWEPHPAPRGPRRPGRPRRLILPAGAA